MIRLSRMMLKTPPRQGSFHSLSPLALLRGAELFEAKVKKLVAARLELEKKSVEALKKE